MAQELRVDPVSPSWERAALLTIDMQNDFALPGGSSFVAGTDAILPQLTRLLAAFRMHSRPVFHAMRLYLEDGSNAERSRRDRLKAGSSIARPGTVGANLVEPIHSAASSDRHAELLNGEWLPLRPSEWLFYKPRWSAFYRTELEARLHALAVDTLVVAGCNFPNCPSATLFDATERDFRVVLASDAVSGLQPPGADWCQGIGVIPLPTDTIVRELHQLAGFQPLPRTGHTGSGRR